MLLSRLLEFSFLVVVIFVSFLAFRTPYEILEQDLKDKQNQHQIQDINIKKRLLAFFFFGAPLIYMGLRISNLGSQKISFEGINSWPGLIAELLSVIKHFEPTNFVLAIIPFFLIIIIKVQIEKVWCKLNKESVRLFNVRIYQFRDQRTVYRLLKKAKKKHQQEFRNLMLEIVKSSKLIYLLSGVFFLFIFSTLFTKNHSVTQIFSNLIPLLGLWFVLSLFLAYFEKQICEFIGHYLGVEKIIF